MGAQWRTTYGFGFERQSSDRNWIKNGHRQGYECHRAQEGANVVVTDIFEDQIKAVVNEVKSFEVNAMALRADVTDANQVQEMVKKVMDRFGKIDILVNNAGRAGNWEAGYKPGPFVESRKEDWEYTIKPCLYGMMNCTETAVFLLRTEPAGSQAKRSVWMAGTQWLL